MNDIPVARETLQQWRMWIGLANNTLLGADIGRGDHYRLDRIMDDLRALLAQPESAMEQKSYIADREGIIPEEFDLTYRGVTFRCRRVEAT